MQPLGSVLGKGHGLASEHCWGCSGAAAPRGQVTFQGSEGAFSGRNQTCDQHGKCIPWMFQEEPDINRVGKWKGRKVSGSGQRVLGSPLRRQRGTEWKPQSSVWCLSTWLWGTRS